MTKEVAQSEVRSWLADYLARRRDLGLGKAVLTLLLEPPNPFEPEARRRPRKMFVLTLLWLLALSGVFGYFNLWS